MRSRWTLIALVCTATAVACGGGERDADGTDPTLRPAGGGPSAAGRFEVEWMSSKIPHHEDAVEMADACLQAGVRPALATFCEGIRTAQTTEIGWMIGWLQEWYGVASTGNGGGRGVGGMGGADLGTLRGTEFERAFLAAMIPHHAMAVHVSQPCVVRATHAELAELCASIVETQSAEIGQMQAWRCEWFEACGTGSGGMGPGGMGPGRR